MLQTTSKSSMMRMNCTTLRRTLTWRTGFPRLASRSTGCTVRGIRLGSTESGRRVFESTWPDRVRSRTTLRMSGRYRRRKCDEEHRDAVEKYCQVAERGGTLTERRSPRSAEGACDD